MSTGKNILLMTLGSQAMIVPEALAWSTVDFDEVHIITTDQNTAPWNQDKDVQSDWEEVVSYVLSRWNIKLTWSVVKDMPLIQSSEDHRVWTEVLYRWAAGFYEKDHQIYYCLSGGTKTMPASFQNVAKFFGALNQFHVLAHPAPKNLEEVSETISSHEIEYVLLGAETGWSYLLDFAKKQKVLSQCYKPHFYYLEKTKDFLVSQYIEETQQSLYSFISKKNSIPYPFSSLHLLSNAKINQLMMPLSMDDRNWIMALPKIDLHNHLGGFASKGKLLEEVRSAAHAPEKLPEIDDSIYPKDNSWPYPEVNINLSDYMRSGDNTGSKILYDMGCLRKHIELMYGHFIEENLRYVEVRCSPNNYGKKAKMSAMKVLDFIIDSFNDMMRQYNHQCIVKVIIIATRRQQGDLSDISKHLALAITSYFNTENHDDNSCSVVGVDLAGYEYKDTRAEYFQHDFNSIHRCGLAVTAHAGENDDAEGIWQAVYKLHTRRIGHGLKLLEANDLLRTVVERKIGVEMCPFANYQIVGFHPMQGSDKTYPLLDYLERGVMVNVNTDNIGISQASISDNILFLSQLCPGITRMNVLQLISNAIEMGFCNQPLKEELRKSFNNEILKSIEIL